VIIDNDIASMYPMSTFGWMSGKRLPRSLELRVREELAPQKYTVYYSGGDWWEDKDAMMAWCSERFGHRNEGYNNPRWSPGSFEFRFKNQKDAVFFMLKWG
jgi:hypothetical protein